MLKNMKVGTKLIAVLVAPVLVLLILGYVGVSQRLSTSSTTQRVEQLANMAAVNADLAHQLQRESVYSAAYMASAGTQWKPQLDTQRKATDSAVSTYNSTLKKVDPQKASSDLNKDVTAVNSALAELPTQRSSVDGLETPAPTAIAQYDSASTDLAQLNTAIAAAANDPELARSLTTFANLNAVKAAEANEGSLSVALVQAAQFPQTWPSSGQATVPCQVVNSSCDVYNALTVASGDEGNAENVYYDSATADQKGLLRNATGGAPIASGREADLRHRHLRLPGGRLQHDQPAQRLQQRAHPGRRRRRQPGPVVAQGGHRPGQQLRRHRQDVDGQRGQRPARRAAERREDGHR